MLDCRNFDLPARAPPTKTQKMLKTICHRGGLGLPGPCPLYTPAAPDNLPGVNLGVRGTIKKKKPNANSHACTFNPQIN